MTSPRPVGRPRDEAIAGRVLAVTAELLATDGLKALRIDTISERAGVPKSTIYRRWPSLVDLAVDSVANVVGPLVFTPTDDPEADLRSLLSFAHQALVSSKFGIGLQLLATEILQRPEAAQAYRDRVIGPMRAASIEAAQRAVDAGHTNLDPALLVDSVIGALIFRVYYLGETPTAAEAADLAKALSRPRVVESAE